MKDFFKLSAKIFTIALILFAFFMFIGQLSTPVYANGESNGYKEVTHLKDDAGYRLPNGELKPFLPQMTQTNPSLPPVMVLYCEDTSGDNTIPDDFNHKSYSKTFVSQMPVFNPMMQQVMLDWVYQNPVGEKDKSLTVEDMTEFYTKIVPNFLPPELRLPFVLSVTEQSVAFPNRKLSNIGAAHEFCVLSLQKYLPELKKERNKKAGEEAAI